ncbi:hypothetical protein F4820DRAFT_433818 [Hypoxylon rubiginosum]|uniref:Uncharacterized protein n=1 Tax=Hypoxylon rubiginosum TaxID=110542 RepID=A0ACB9YQJ9_9PEZI|nr:hypothetical protein F4820DRAFT_433818 [Hypoxylon rubiginosum]
MQTGSPAFFWSFFLFCFSPYTNYTQTLPILSTSPSRSPTQTVIVASVHTVANVECAIMARCSVEKRGGSIVIVQHRVIVRSW